MRTIFSCIPPSALSFLSSHCDHASGTVMEIWPFEVLPGRLFQEGRSAGRRSVGPQYCTNFIYSSSLR